MKSVIFLFLQNVTSGKFEAFQISLRFQKADLNKAFLSEWVNMIEICKAFQVYVGETR